MNLEPWQYVVIPILVSFVLPLILKFIERKAEARKARNANDVEINNSGTAMEKDLRDELREDTSRYRKLALGQELDIIRLKTVVTGLEQDLLRSSADYARLQVSYEEIDKQKSILEFDIDLVRKEVEIIRKHYEILKQAKEILNDPSNNY